MRSSARRSTARTCSTGAPSSGCLATLRPLLGGVAANPDARLWELPLTTVAERHSAAGRVERHPARLPGQPDRPRVVRRAGAGDARRGRGGVRGPAVHVRRARPSRQPARSPPAHPGRGPRRAGGPLRRALARDGGGPPRDPQGRRCVRAAGSRLSRGSDWRFMLEDTARPRAPHRCATPRSRRRARRRARRRLPGHRLARHCGGGRRTPCRSGDAGHPGLRDLHVGIDGPAQGRVWSSTGPSSGSSRTRTTLGWRRRGLPPARAAGVRRLDVRGLGAAPRTAAGSSCTRRRSHASTALARPCRHGRHHALAHRGLFHQIVDQRRRRPRSAFASSSPGATSCPSRTSDVRSPSGRAYG